MIVATTIQVETDGMRTGLGCVNWCLHRRRVSEYSSGTEAEVWLGWECQEIFYELCELEQGSEAGETYRRIGDLARRVTPAKAGFRGAHQEAG